MTLWCLGHCFLHETGRVKLVNMLNLRVKISSHALACYHSPILVVSQLRKYHSEYSSEIFTDSRCARNENAVSSVGFLLTEEPMV